MNFNHLPVHGGLYDQHPQLLADWEVILNKKNREHQRQQQQREREMKRKGGR